MPLIERASGSLQQAIFLGRARAERSQNRALTLYHAIFASETLWLETRPSTENETELIRLTLDLALLLRATEEILA